MDEPIVRVEHLSHRYSVQWAIRDINLEIKKKGVFGLLGSNGAGKSTTMNIMCGVLNQTEGEVFVNGISLRENPVEAKKFIGFLPQKPPLYADFTVDEYLVYCAQLRHMDSKSIRAAVDCAKEKCGIMHYSKRLISNLSGGYQQRVGIARAYCNEPLVMLLDEPFGHLDAQTRYLMQDELTRIWQAEKRTVIFVTNNIEEAVYLADRILVLRNCPTGVKAEYEINLPRPRNYTDPEFLRLRREIDSVVDHTL